MPSHNSPFFSTVLNQQDQPSPTSADSPFSSPARTSSDRIRTQTNSPSNMHTNQNSFTPAQQSLQARNKPFTSPSMGESYEARERRAEAVRILENAEILMWYSMARNESLPATRAYYEAISYGFTPPEDANPVWREEYEIPAFQRVSHSRAPPASGASPSPSRSSAKGKEKARRQSARYSLP